MGGVNHPPNGCGSQVDTTFIVSNRINYNTEISNIILISYIDNDMLNLNDNLYIDNLYIIHWYILYVYIYINPYYILCFHFLQFLRVESPGSSLSQNQIEPGGVADDA